MWAKKCKFDIVPLVTGWSRLRLQQIILKPKKGHDRLRDSFAGIEKDLSNAAYTYSKPPYVFGVKAVYVFFGLRAIGGSNVVDSVPDGNITFLGAPSFLVVSRFTSSPWGPWDQVITLMSHLSVSFSFAFPDRNVKHSVRMHRFMYVNRQLHTTLPAHGDC
jgi:hypothetical protein